MKILIGNQEQDLAWKPAFDKHSDSLQYEEVTDVSDKEACDFILYVVSPEMYGMMAVIDAVNDSNHSPGKTLFCFLEEGESEAEFNSHQVKSLVATGKMVARNGGHWFRSLEDTVHFLSRQE